MNKEIQKQLTEILPKLETALEKGVSYGGDLFHRAVAFFMWKEGVVLGISSAVFLALALGLYKLIRKIIRENKKGGKEEDVEELMLISLFFSVPIIISFIFLMTSLMNIIQLAYIPELYIIKEIQALIK